mmetsp:Transcript_42038/g.97942  ORF Transcript_42038/g.97942 Transcript_42038/m.97942 type:complete len:236 (+) Transcript_42038:523-1230(+)
MRLDVGGHGNKKETEQGLAKVCIGQGDGSGADHVGCLKGVQDAPKEVRQSPDEAVLDPPGLGVKWIVHIPEQHLPQEPNDCHGHPHKLIVPHRKLLIPGGGGIFQVPGFVELAGQSPPHLTSRLRLRLRLPRLSQTYAAVHHLELLRREKLEKSKSVPVQEPLRVLADASEAVTIVSDACVELESHRKSHTKARHVHPVVPSLLVVMVALDILGFRFLPMEEVDRGVHATAHVDD